ncbi:hypothetical protein PQE68_gp026 [Bacillus phage vB_BanS_Sophrita]|uniref:Uncharacterized protein n=1 Tax=Bacillus phage vB_BanS_Sophrita TaxID=2894790 RepID=A0AAE8YU36_9CAUD|nr:hypothetical protein PQE68_gp026 [Bacillus phage vB_BanS_Sophrita]UGO50617.1 hypothetical protein SOPHRITA_26 [Bacillus phage vB_BanS_Sophrita]
MLTFYSDDMSANLLMAVGVLLIGGLMLYLMFKL